MAQLKATTVNGNLTVTGGNISGNLNAGQLATGTVPEARLTKATTSVYGITKLNNSTSSTATAEAATAAAVKSANDNANTRLKLDGTTTMTGTLKVNGTNGIEFGNGGDSLTFDDATNIFEFKADGGTSSNVKAGTFQGALSGKASTAGTADQANKWTTARTITLGGDLTGSVSIDGAQNVTLNAEVKDNSHSHSYLPLSGGTTTGTIHANVNTNANILTWKGSSSSGMLRKITDQGGTLLSSDSNVWIHAGDSAITHVADAGIVASTSTEDLVLSADSSIRFVANAQSGYAGASKFHINSNGWNGNVVGSVNGNAATASKWANARTITLGGDLSGSVSIDGSANVTLSGQVADDSHNHSSLTSKESTTYLRDHGNGNVTLSAGKNGSGTVGDLYIGYNSGTSYVTTNVRLCRPMNWNGSHTIVDSNGKVPWSSLTGIPSSFTPSSHTHDDRYYTESEMNTKLDAKANTSGSYTGLRTGKSIVHDTRGANRAPNYYDKQSTRFDFVEGSQLGFGSNWTSLMTIYPWTSYNDSHRPVQMAFSGSKLGFRWATSDTAWGGWADVYHTSNKPTWSDVGAIQAGNWRTNGGQDLLVHNKRAVVGMTSGNLHLSYGGDFSNLYFNDRTIWHSGNFDPNSKLSSNPNTINMSKNGTVSRINFAANGNDPGYIEHYENNNTSRLRFVVSDDASATQDLFEFGNTTGGTYQSRFEISSSGQARTCAASNGSWWDIGGAWWSTAGPSGSAPKGAIWVQY